jgi:IS605 OrfB family transposase
MKLTVKTKLLTNDEQFKSLKATMEMFNQACNFVSEIAFNADKFRQVTLHYIAYTPCREKFPKLSAQFVVRAIAVVADSYKADKKTLHKFKPHAAVVYDQRILSFKALDLISIASVDGRLKVPVFIHEYRKPDRNSMRGQADLALENGKFFLNVVVEVPEEMPIDPEGVLGVDKGIVQIAYTSDGESFSGQSVDKIRERYTNLRKELQACGSKSAKRHLKKIAKKQARYQKDRNHCISKQIVETAKGTNRAIALEDLSGIRDRQTVRKADRQRFGNWAFYQLDSFISYKAKIAGVPVIFVDPRNTSRTCPICGFVSKSNRRTQDSFSCLSCNFSANADFVGSLNISNKGLLSTNLSQSTFNPLYTAEPPGTASCLVVDMNLL